MDQFKVNVIKFNDRKFLQMVYLDPMNGRKVTKSTGTTIRREAEKVAAKWEAELQEGRYSQSTKIVWKEFRERYEGEVLPGLAKKTGEKLTWVFNLVEKILNPARIRDLTTDRLSYFQSKLREAGKAETTIASALAHLRSALQWAMRMNMIAVMPKIERPKRAKGGKVMKGRPITGEEFDRLLTKVEAGLIAAATPRGKGKPTKKKRKQSETAKAAFQTRRAESVAKVAESWRHYLRGLWLSGLRLEESLELYWDRDDKLRVNLSGKRPMLRIPAELEKGNKDRLLPMAPEFAELLLATPKAERSGPVFCLRSRDGGQPLNAHRVCEIVCAIGRAAGVKVNTDAKTGKVKYASAHDLRRSFGERWAAKVMPQVLMELMRHESIETTMKFYVGRNAEKTADILWEAYRPGLGYSSGYSDQNSDGAKKETRRKSFDCNESPVDRGGIEPPTHGFSVHCSTN